MYGYILFKPCSNHSCLSCTISLAGATQIEHTHNTRKGNEENAYKLHKASVYFYILDRQQCNELLIEIPRCKEIIRNKCY